MITIIFSAFLIGYSTLLYQIIFLREFLTIYYGNELCIGTVLALWLLGTSIGGAIGAKIAGRIKNNRDHFLFILLFLVHLLFPVLLFCLRISIKAFITTKGEYLPIYYLFAQCLIFMFPLNIIIGLMFPMFCASAKKRTDYGFIVGTIYLSESAGALCAGIIFTFILVDRLDYFQIATIQLVLAAIAVILYFYREKRAKKTLFILFALLCFILIFPAASWVDQKSITRRWDAFFSPLSLTESIDTRYQNVAICSHDKQLDVYTNLKYRFSIPDPYTNEIYSQLISCQCEKPDNILLIGGVYSGIAKACLSHHPKKIDVIELDKKYVQLIEKNLSPDLKNFFKQKQKNISLKFIDGRFYIKTQKTLYDVVFINTPEPDSAMLNRFYTVNFFRELKTNLSDNGICALKAISAPNYIGDEIQRYNKTIYHTLKEVFADVIAVPGEKITFIACKNKNILSADPAELIKRYRKRGVTAGQFSPEIFYPILEPDRLQSLEAKLRAKASSIRINTDTNPIAYYINLYLWDTFSGSKLHPVLNFTEKIRPIHVVFVLAALMCFLLLPQFIKPFSRKNNNFFKPILYWIIFSTGFTGMGIELFLIFMFQNIFGYLYSMIGFIVALFMFGLAAGSLMAMRCVKRAKSESFILKILIIAEISIPLLSFSLPFFMAGLTSISNTALIYIIFTVLVSVCGFLTGIEFPLTAHLLTNINKDIGFSSGILSNADHLGAFFGSLAVGTFLIPILGTTATAYIIGFLNLSSFILLVSSPFSIRLIKK